MQSSEWVIDRLIDMVRAKYKVANLPWDREFKDIQGQLEGLAKHLGDRYGRPSVIAVGGAGIILKVSDRDLNNSDFAVKFPRPIPGREKQMTELLEKEIRCLSRIRHESIVRIVGAGWFDVRGGTRFPYYVMDYIKGQSSRSFLRENEVSEEEFIRIVHLTVDAIHHMHHNPEVPLVHLDVKADNILINADKKPVLADLGTTKALDPDSDEYTLLAGTRSLAHDEHAAYLETDSSDPNRAEGRVRRKDIKLYWDFVPLGWTILRWLGYSKDKPLDTTPTYVSPYTKKYLMLMAARLLGKSVPGWLTKRLGLPDSGFIHDLAYRDISEVLRDIRKLSGDYSLIDEVPELNPYHPDVIQVSRDAPTNLSERVKLLIDHPALRRLGSITQLGLLNQVYPTATHSRLEHTLGTYHNTCRYVLTLYYDPLSPFFRQVMNASDIRAVLVCSLVHDVGQFPLAHDLEEIDSTTYSHKRLTIRLTKQAKDMEAPHLHLGLKDALEAWGVEAERVISILSARPTDGRVPVKDRILNSIIDGPIDADKLDYLRRDSDRLRVPYARGIDVDRILRNLTVVIHQEDGRSMACVGVHEKAKVPAEFVLIARYAMYTQAYWQHTVRCMKAMLARAVYRLLQEAGEDKAWAKALERDFENLVLSLPQPPKRSQAVQQLELFEDDSEESEMRSTISPTDAAVLRFLRRALISLQAPEAELLDDLLNRRLYKRLFVVSKDRQRNDWRLLVPMWDRLTLPEAKIAVCRKIEEAIADRAGEDPPTTVTGLDDNVVPELKARVQSGRPLILIDLPPGKPGSDTPLYCVVEAQRRALRKDERAVGEPVESSVWEDFGLGMRERAGKFRVFCHWRFIDLVESIFEFDDFIEIFCEAVSEELR